MANDDMGSSMLRTRAALLTIAILSLSVACDDAGQETVVPPSVPVPVAADSKPTPPPPAERPTTVYTAVGPEAEAFGLLSVMLPPGGVGGARTFTFGTGAVFETELVGVADITKPIGAASMAKALGITQQALENGGDPRTYLLKVSSEVSPAGGGKACGDTSPAYLLTRQLEIPTDQTVTVVLLSEAPGELGATVCKKLVYTAR